eukprot:56033_1
MHALCELLRSFMIKVHDDICKWWDKRFICTIAICALKSFSNKALVPSIATTYCFNQIIRQLNCKSSNICLRDEIDPFDLRELICIIPTKSHLYFLAMCLNQHVEVIPLLY